MSHSSTSLSLSLPVKTFPIESEWDHNMQQVVVIIVVVVDQQETELSFFSETDFLFLFCGKITSKGDKDWPFQSIPFRKSFTQQSEDVIQKSCKMLLRSGCFVSLFLWKDKKVYVDILLPRKEADEMETEHHHLRRKRSSSFATWKNKSDLWQ